MIPALTAMLRNSEVLKTHHLNVSQQGYANQHSFIKQLLLLLILCLPIEEIQKQIAPIITL
jgi:hypothetical protein